MSQQSQESQADEGIAERMLPQSINVLQVRTASVLFGHPPPSPQRCVSPESRV